MAVIQLEGITFEWSDAKAVSNRAKHGIRFETAAEVFFDPFLELSKPPDSGDERRQAVVGLTSDWRLLFVVFVERGDRIRMISAREATSQERKSYED